MRERLDAALEDSETLVVLCSPAAARSAYVNGEIETFQRLNREGRIFPVIASGEPESGDPETECFPPALRGRGVLAADLREVKLPDGRVVGDGRDGGRLKLLSGLLGLPLDAIVQRERRRQRLQVAAATGAAALFAFIAAAAIFQTFAARAQTAKACAQQSAIAIRGRDYPKALTTIAEAVRQLPEQRGQFLTQMRWMAFVTRGQSFAHIGANTIDDISVSPQQRFFASVRENGILQVTDRGTARTWQKDGAGSGGYNSVSLSDRFVAALRAVEGRNRVEIELLDATDGRKVGSIPVSFPVLGTHGVALSPDGRFAAICHTAFTAGYDVAAARELWRTPDRGYLGYDGNDDAVDCIFDSGSAILAIQNPYEPMLLRAESGVRVDGVAYKVDAWRTLWDGPESWLGLSEHVPWLG